MSGDYDKATEKSESAPKGHASAVREAIEDGKTRDGHLSTHNAPKATPSRKMTGGPGGEVL